MPIAHEKPLQVTLLGFSDREQAIMGLFLSKYCTCEHGSSTDEPADLCILDLDNVKGQALLRTQRCHHPQRPVIALSIREHDIDGIQFLRKPLRIDALKSAIEYTRTTLVLAVPPVPETTTGHCAVTTTQRGSSTREQANQTNPPGYCLDDPHRVLRSMEASTRIAHECCGKGGIEFRTGKDTDKLYYNHGIHFQHLLQSAIGRSRREMRPMNLLLRDSKTITLLPRNGIALTDITDAKLRPRCLMAMRPEDVDIEPSKEGETSLLRDNGQQTSSIDALLWKVTLWGSHGRLPRGTDFDSLVQLRQWPNMTRLLWIPQFTRIASLWARNPVSLVETADTLDMEARYVCSFYSGCCALDLLTTRTDEPRIEVAPISTADPSRAGLLRRILRRLRIT